MQQHETNLRLENGKALLAFPEKLALAEKSP
jgi:hypothetical protein